MRYFGSKEELFARAARFDLKLPDLSKADRSKIGEMLVRHFLSLWEGENANGGLTVLCRSAASNKFAANKLREIFCGQVLPAIAKIGGQTGAAERAGLDRLQLLGLAFCRYVVKFPPVVGLSQEQIIREIGHTIQRYATGRIEQTPCLTDTSSAARRGLEAPCSAIFWRQRKQPAIRTLSMDASSCPAWAEEWRLPEPRHDERKGFQHCLSECSSGGGKGRNRDFWPPPDAGKSGRTFRRSLTRFSRNFRRTERASKGPLAAFSTFTCRAKTSLHRRFPWLRQSKPVFGISRLTERKSSGSRRQKNPTTTSRGSIVKSWNWRATIQRGIHGSMRKALNRSASAMRPFQQIPRRH